MEAWKKATGYIIELSRDGLWGSPVLFWAVVAGLVIFVLLLVRFARTRSAAERALRVAHDLVGDLTEFQRRMTQQLDARDNELKTRMTKRLDQKGDLIQGRMDERATALSDSVGKVDARVSTLNEDMDRFRRQIAEVEGRIPTLFDKLDEFRDTLAKIFQAELGGVLNSFDNSVAAILDQMKSELQMGIARIESIESMVRSREKAERTLLGAPDESELLRAPQEAEEELPAGETEAAELELTKAPEEAAGQGAPSEEQEEA